MIDYVVTAAVAAASLCWGAVIGTKLVRKPPPVLDEEPRCTGYVAGVRRPDGKFGPHTYHADCRALRSPTCTDGRCAWHCQQMCKCDQPRPTPR